MTFPYENQTTPASSKKPVIILLYKDILFTFSDQSSSVGVRDNTWTNIQQNKSEYKRKKQPEVSCI